jgi:archaemetzincin
MTAIHLIPISLHDPQLLSQLCEDVGHVFHSPTTLRPMPINASTALDASRQQYHSGQLLVDILSCAPEGNSKLLGVTAHDLFLPVLTFVFGQAQVRNRAAIYSTFRLRNEFYGLPPDPELLYERALKEALHELGHTFGLRHCLMHPCAMNASTYVEDIDLKPPGFCDACWAGIEEHG